MNQGIEIVLWLNGEKKDHSFKFIIEDFKNMNIRRLKDCIKFHIKNNNLESKILEIPHKTFFEITHIYTINELDLEDYDIQYLTNDDILFFTIDQTPFKITNHYYQYEFIKCIKSGGFGKVYLAKNVITQKEYAIKQIDSSKFSNEEIYNISREHMILKSFNHKNIIKCYDSFNYDNFFYTVMDFAKGGELTHLLNEKKRLTELECKTIFKQIYDAVCYIHEQNIIHRDLKPNNILFLDKEKTQIVLIDFGISGFCNGRYKETIKAGTTLFLPPEVVGGYDFTSSTKLDIWALGIILYRMVEGIYPFKTKNDKDIIYNILNSSIKFNEKIHISHTCKKLISKMLEKNFLFRIDTDSELFKNWFDEKIDIKECKTVKNKKINYVDFNHTFIRRNSLIEKSSHTPYSNIIKKKIHEFLISGEKEKNKEKEKEIEIDKEKEKDQENNKTNLSNNINNVKLKNISLKSGFKKEFIIFPKIKKNNINIKNANNNSTNDSLESSLTLRKYYKNKTYFKLGNKKLTRDLSCTLIKTSRIPFFIPHKNSDKIKIMK